MARVYSSGNPDVDQWIDLQHSQGKHAPNCPDWCEGARRPGRTPGDANATRAKPTGEPLSPPDHPDPNFDSENQDSEPTKITSHNELPPDANASLAKTTPEHLADQEQDEDQSAFTSNDVKAQPADLLADLHDGAWLNEQKFPPICFLLPGLLPEGMSVLVAAPKIGKSWIALDVALACAAGGSALGRINVGEARPVLLLALEDGYRRLQDRCRVLLGDAEIPDRLNILTKIEPGTVVESITAWLETLPPDHNPPLVIIDTLGKVLPPSLSTENSYIREYVEANRLKRIADDHPGLGLLVLHHDRKASSADFVDAANGTRGITGAPDTVIVLSRKRGSNDGLLQVTSREIAEREYAITRDQTGGWQLDGADLDAAAAKATERRVTANLGDRSTDVLRYVEQHPGGVRRADVAQALHLTLPEATTYLTRLYETGRLQRPTRGLYKPVMSVMSVISDGEDQP